MLKIFSSFLAIMILLLKLEMNFSMIGRGGSDGCKVPMKIETLQGQGVMKVECGSQFSVALTKSGSVYTW